jgi:hypothetical protein
MLGVQFELGSMGSALDAAAIVMRQLSWQLLGCALLFVCSFVAFWTERKAEQASCTVLLAIYAVTVVAVLMTAGFADVALSTIHGMQDDNLWVYTFAKNYINGFGSRLNPNLGFPGVLDNAYYPSFDFIFRAFLRLCSFFTSDPVVSYNLMYFAGVSTMVGATIASLRALSIPAWLSILGAAVYVVSPYFIFRSLVHDFLSLYVSAPMGGALAILVGTTTVSQYFRRPFVWASILFIATSGFYYAFFTCLFVALVGFSTAIGRRRLALAVPALILPALILPLLVTTGYGLALVDVLGGKIKQVQRFPFEQLSYGLSMAEASHVFADITPLKWVLDAYLAVMPGLYGANGLFEWPGVLLSLVILTSPVLALASGLAQTRRSQMIFVSASCIAFGLIYAERGGLAYFFNLLVTPQIRATARIMPFLSFFALVVVLSAICFGADSRRRWVGLGGSALLLTALLMSAVPNVGAFGRKAAAVAALPSLQLKYTSIKAMLSAKDKAGVTTVLQLPHMAFPEVGPKLQFDAYDHMLAFVFDRSKSTTRWSYGSNLNQDSFMQVADLVATHQTAGLAGAASDFGFDAVLIEKAAYTELELIEVRSTVESDISCVTYEDKYRVLYLLRKSCS